MNHDLSDLVCDDPEARQALETLVLLLHNPETLVEEDAAWRGFTDRIQAVISKNRRLLALAEQNKLNELMGDEEHA